MIPKYIFNIVILFLNFQRLSSISSNQIQCEHDLNVRGESRIQIMFQVIKLFSALSTHFQNHDHTGFDCLFGKKFLLISAAQLEAATCLPSFLVLCTTVHDQAIGTLPQTPSNIYSLYCTMITFAQISSKIPYMPFLIFIKGQLISE